MDTIGLTSGSTMIGLTIGIGLSALAVFLLAKRQRWFGRFRGGFAVALAVAFTLVGLITAGVLGVWSYVEARQIVLGQFAQRLADVGRLSEADLTRDIHTTVEKLKSLADGDLVEQSIRTPDLALAELAAVQRWNSRLLHFNVYDASGRRVLSQSRTLERQEATNRVGVAYALEGKSFVSEPYFSPVYERFVLYVSVPVRAAPETPVLGAVTMRYDLQEDIRESFAAHHFGETGDVLLAAADGTVLASHDGDEHGRNIYSTAVFQAAMSETVGTLVADSPHGEMLYGFRKLPNPSTVGGKPLVLITEISHAEVMAEVYALRGKLMLGAAALAGFWVVLAGAVAAMVTRPLRTLVDATLRVRDGDMSVQVPLVGRDEIAQFAGAFNGMVTGLAERDRVKQLFGRYLTTQVSETILKNGDAAIAGQRKRVTILFADIRDFTTISERLTPEQVVEMLNDYFSEMVDAVFEFGGVLDKFIGDGMLAVFGSLDDKSDHARRAVQCALRMKARLAKINGERQVRGEPPINIGIGIHTDEVVVGNIGSRKRMEYTVIGDGVNTCSRVESMNKQLNTTMLITEQTRADLGDDFVVEAKPECAAKGKSRPVRVFEVMSHRAAPLAHAA